VSRILALELALLENVAIELDHVNAASCRWIYGLGFHASISLEEAAQRGQEEAVPYGNGAT
jgi:hypothetical protein